MPRDARRNQQAVVPLVKEFSTNEHSSIHLSRGLSESLELDSSCVNKSSSRVIKTDPGDLTIPTWTPFILECGPLAKVQYPSLIPREQTTGEV